MSNSAPQVEVPFSDLIQRQFVLVFVVYQPVQLCALALLVVRELRPTSFYVHLLMAQSRDWLHCVVEALSDFFMCHLGIRRFFPAQAVRSLRGYRVDDLCIDTRLIRVAHFASALAPVHLLAHDRICSKSEEKYQCGGSHQASLTTPVGDAVSALCPSPAHQGPSDSLAAPAAAGQGVDTTSLNPPNLGYLWCTHCDWSGYSDELEADRSIGYQGGLCPQCFSYCEGQA